VSSRLLAALADRPLLLDGGMGTRLIARGLDLTADDPALWNLSRPEIVRDVHARDIAAGSDVLLTNTFGANAAWLARLGRAGEMVAINRTAVALASEAAGPDRFVLGSIGPTAGELARDQAEILAESGVDGLILETHRSDDALARLGELRRDLDLPILVGLFAFHEPIAEAGRRLADAGADVVGINCIPPEWAPEWIEDLWQAIPTVPLLCKPSAAHPDWPPIPPAALAAGVPALLRHGVRLLGGCCGATEAHVAALRSALDRAAARGL
jgi:methionine synthase I (cobalamin-dependent)